MSPADDQKNTRVFIVDGHPPVRDALRSTVDSTPTMQVSGSAERPVEALRRIEDQSPTVVVSELSVGGEDGLLFVQNVRSRTPEVRVLIFSSYDENVYAERAIESGAHGYLMKTESLIEVVRAVKWIRQGELYLSRSVSSRMLRKRIHSQGDAIHTPFEKLSNRELTVVRKIGEGYTVQQIANHLDRARKTIEMHRRRAKEKMGFQTIKDLYREATKWVGPSTPEGEVRRSAV